MNSYVYEIIVVLHFNHSPHKTVEVIANGVEVSPQHISIYLQRDSLSQSELYLLLPIVTTTMA